MSAPQIVSILRAENAKLLAEVERSRRREEWSWRLACERVTVLETALREIAAHSYGTKRAIATSALRQPLNFLSQKGGPQ